MNPKLKNLPSIASGMPVGGSVSGQHGAGVGDHRGGTGTEPVAVVYCQGAFSTTNGKTAHGLVRLSRRYRIVTVMDSTLAGRDAGEVLDGQHRGILVTADLEGALEFARTAGTPASHFIIGLTPDGGRLPPEARNEIIRALDAGLHVVAGLHDFLCEDPQLMDLAAARGVTLTDVRKPPPRSKLHAFTGKIEQVESFRVALLGTDSAVGKRTTAWLLLEALEAAGHPTEMVGTGQTAWLQGAEYSLVLDSLVNDFVAGEIEHCVWRAWNERRPEYLLLEGQGSLMNPAYPGGLELLAAGRPHVIVLQHAPGRCEYDGFPGFPIHDLDHQVRALEIVSGRPVVAVTLNHQGLEPGEVERVRRRLERETGLSVLDPLGQGLSKLVKVLESATHLNPKRGGQG